MRPGLDATTQALYDSGEYDVHYRLKVENGSGTKINLQGRYYRLNWRKPDPKEPIASISFDAIRELTESGATNSLSPGIVGSDLNKLDDGVTYSPLLQLGRRVTLDAILTDVGDPRPADADLRWYEVFQGVITEVDWPDWDSRRVSVSCNDLGSILKAQKSESAYEYAAGTSIETVARQILDNNGFNWIPIYFPVATGKVLPNIYAPGVQKPVWDQVWALAQSMGWICFFRYRGQNPVELTFFAPAREKSVADATVEAWDYRGLGIDENEVRNVGRLVYWDLNGTQQLVGPVINQGSIDKYGGYRRPFWIKLEEDSPIRTETEALEMLMAAVSDVSDPNAIASILTRPLIFAEVGEDLYTFPAKGRFFDSDQTFAPFSISIDVQEMTSTCVVDVRGVPTAGTKTWRQLTGTPTPPGVIFQYAEDTAGTGATDVLDEDVHLYVRQSKNGGASWSDWQRIRPLPVAEVEIIRQSSSTAIVQFAGSDGAGEPAEAVEYSYAVGDENEADLTNIVGGWSAWAAVPDTVNVARNPFFRKVVYAKVRDKAGAESPVVALPVQPIYHSFGRVSGRIEWMKRGTVNDEPTENLFKRDFDTLDNVLDSGTYRRLGSGYTDTSHRLTNVYRGTTVESVGNLFKRNFDTLDQVLNSATYRRTGASYVDTSARIHSVYRGSQVELADNLFKRNSDTLDVVGDGVSFRRVAAGYVDASNRLDRVYNTAAASTVLGENVFRKNIDTAEFVAPTAIRTFISPTYVDASLRPEKVRNPVTASDVLADNIFRKDVDTMDRVLDTSTRKAVQYDGGVPVFGTRIEAGTYPIVTGSRWARMDADEFTFKYFDFGGVVTEAGMLWDQLNGVLTLITRGGALQIDDNGNVTASGTISGSGSVSSVFGRTGAVVAQAGDYTPAQVGAEPAFSKNTAFNKNFGTVAGTVAAGNHLHTGVYSPVGHGHAIADVANLQSTLDNKANLAGPTFTGQVTFRGETRFDTDGGNTPVWFTRLGSAAEGLRIHATDRDLYTDYLEDTPETNPGTWHFRIGLSDESVLHEWLTVDAFGAALFGASVSLAAGQKLYLDGGGDTYLHESSDDVLDFVRGGTTALRLSTDAVFLTNLSMGGNVLYNVGDLRINAGNKLFLDGSGDTYLHEPAANVMGLVAGGKRVNLSASAFHPAVNGQNNLGLSAYRWDTVYGVTGNFSGTIYGADVDVSGGASFGATVTAPRFTGSLYRYDGSAHIFSPADAWYKYSAATVTGAIKIRLPKLNSSTMMKMRVEVYTYSGDSLTFWIEGYVYSSGTWPNVNAVQLGRGDAPFTIRYGDDGVRSCVWIGETSTQWSYMHVRVAEVMVSVTNTTGWESGWEVSVVSAFDTVTKTVTPRTYAETQGAVFTGGITLGAPLTDDSPPIDWLESSGYGGRIYYGGANNHFHFGTLENGTFVEALRIVRNNASLYPQSHVIMGATARLYLDAGGDTYLSEVAANQVGLYVGGSSYRWTLSAFYPYGDRDLGANTRPWKDLILSGSLKKDGSYISVLTTAGSAQAMKVGGLTISNSYSDGHPTNGLFVKGAADFQSSLTLAGDLTVNGAEGIYTRRGIMGGYADTAGSGTTWGANIWGMGDAYSGSGYGTGFVISGGASSQYGLAWLRGSHPSADGGIGEGLYIYQAGVLRAGLGSNGGKIGGTLDVGGTAHLRGGLRAYTQRIYLDNGDDTYIHEASANNPRIVIGGNDAPLRGIKVANGANASGAAATGTLWLRYN